MKPKLKFDYVQAEIDRRYKRENLAAFQYGQFYDWQHEFCEDTKDYFESCLCAANQIGKTFIGTTLDAFHLTGDYPKGYEG